MKTIRLGISTCPNDTFAFHALLTGQVHPSGVELEIELMDIEELNERMSNGQLDAAKVSYAAAVDMAADIWVLPSGSALGYGVGPLLLAARPDTQPQSPEQLALCPGRWTTAALLFQLFYPQTARVEHVVFSQIMPRLKARHADFGVCIHEGRFTWQEQGLHLVEDLGQRWETETGQPLPLGGLVVRRRVGREAASALQQAVRASLEYAKNDPQLALPTMRRYAQEFADHVLMQHVDLYVNRWTYDLGDEGRAAIACLSRYAARHSPHGPAELTVLPTTAD
ncbi:MAG: 1,4-dihydroxy-6-naphtoate synthase [Pirellulaceae bacterium]|nr:MAG: 1,4-dihydroxy-6-naphtoate synthase [Pirellulaceae bacterium]